MTTECHLSARVYISEIFFILLTQLAHPEKTEPAFLALIMEMKLSLTLR